jgi:hypothetical protein
MALDNMNLTRWIAPALLLCLAAGSAFAGGGIKHPSDYGSPPNPIAFQPCSTASQTVDGVIASCYTGTGGNPFDFLFTFALVTPSASTSITSVTFTLADLPSDYGLLEGTSSDCAAMNIACTPSAITINDASPLATGTGNTFTFTNFTGNLMATEYFSYSDTETAPSFTAATTSSTTATPEPGEAGFLIAAFSSLFFLRRRQQAKQNA